MGVVFKYDLETSVYTRLADLDESTGKYPVGGSLFVLNKTIAATSPLKNFFTVDSETDTELGVLTDGTVVDKADINIGVRTNDSIAFVEFYLNGKRMSTDKNPPFALYAEQRGDYKKGHLKNGSHTLTAIGYASNGQDQIGKDTLTIHFVMNGISLASRINMFPIPAKDNLTLEFNGVPNTVVNIEVKDYAGMNVKASGKGHTDSEGFFSYNIATAHFKKGIYVLLMKTNGEVIQKRFSVQ